MPDPKSILEIDKPQFEPADVLRTYIPMRDGVRIYLEAYLPDGPGPFPTLLSRTPYHDANVPPMTRKKGRFIEFVSRGYAVVEAQARGTGISEGRFYFLRNEGEDGCDTIAWIRDQPWSGGAVGLMGLSYGGMNQFAVAGMSPPGLKAMFAGVFGADLYHDLVYPGGVLSAGSVRWALHQVANTMPPWVPNLYHAPDPVIPGLLPMQTKVYGDRVQAALESARQGLGLAGYDFFHDWLDHPADGAYWDMESPDKYFPRIKTPFYALGGWFDYFPGAVIRAFNEIDAPKKLTMGPWFHSDSEGEMYTIERLRWFGHWMKGIDTGVMNEPAVNAYCMGADEWRVLDAWPPKTQEMRLYPGEGALFPSPAATGSISIAHDPKRPVPSISMRNMDISAAEKDMLTFTMPPLETDLEIAGAATVRFHFSTTARDIDWIAKLCHVTPAGESRVLAAGVRKGTHYRSHTEPEPLTPDRVYEIEMTLNPTYTVIPKGHALRLSLASSDFPILTVNPIASANVLQWGGQYDSVLTLPRSV